jgi:hypothetical protein
MELCPCHSVIVNYITISRVQVFFVKFFRGEISLPLERETSLK